MNLINPYRYLALEFAYQASMDQLFLADGDPNKFTGQMPSEKVLLLQLANGLNYIHSKNLVHRDIRPENVHIFPPSNGFGPAVVKWTGFGLVKQLPPGGLYSINKSSDVKGSLNWMPPELLDFVLDKKSSDSTGIFGCKENDVFAAGCLFFAYLTGGVHPFGSGREIVANIKQMFAVNVHSKRNILLFVFSSIYLLVFNLLPELSFNHFAYVVVVNVMLRKEPGHRTNWMNALKEVIMVSKNKTSEVKF